MILRAFAILALIGASSTHANSSPDPAADRVSGLSLFEDTVGLVDPEFVLEQRTFSALASRVPNFPVSASTKWLRFTITNHGGSPFVVLSIPYAEIDELDLYSIESDGTARIAHSGRSVSPLERFPLDGVFHFELPLQQGSSRELLIRVRGFKPIHLPLIVETPGEAMRSNSLRKQYTGFYAGIMLAMALYNLFVYLSIRDRSYLYYVLYIIIICTAQLTFLMPDPYGLWSSSSWFDSRSSIIFALGAIALGIVFAQRFMDTRERTPRLHKIGPVFLGLIAINGALYCIADPSIGYQLAQVLGGWSAVYLLTTAIIAWKGGSRTAGYFLLAWSSFLAAVVVFVLKDAGVLPFNDLTQYAMPIGSAIEGVLLSFGLADRINVLRREKEQSQAEALRASVENERLIREQNIVLEEKVQERTHALQETNDHLKRTQTQLVNSEKMASLGQLTAGIAHEINNPINFITSNIAPLRRNIGDLLEVVRAYRELDPVRADEQLRALRSREKELGLEESIEELDGIIGSVAEGASRTAEIVRGLRNFSRLDEDDLKDADLNDGLRSTLTVLAPQYRDKVEFDLQLADLPRVECFPGKLNQVFMNIITNGAQATLMRTDGRPRKVTLSTRENGGSVEVLIADTGVGMSADIQSRIFDPFFTTKPVGEGTGLGLAIVYGIINDHGGAIAVESQPGVGTEFRITLPVRRQRKHEMRA